MQPCKIAARQLVLLLELYDHFHCGICWYCFLALISFYLIINTFCYSDHCINTVIAIKITYFLTVLIMLVIVAISSTVIITVSTTGIFIL